MTSKEKGAKAEKEVENIYKNRGYFVMRAKRSMKPIYIQGKTRYVSQDNDFFNLFDICAKNKEGETVWIQVKTGISNVSKAKRDIEFKQEYFEVDLLEIWARIKNKGYKVYLYDGDDWNVTNCNFKGEIIRK